MSQLDRRVILEGGFPSEVDLLVADLNRLLDGQREQVGKARRQAGDLAHALKTPLTIIEGEAHVIAADGHLASADLIRLQVASMRRHMDRALARTRTHALASTGAVSCNLSRLVTGLTGLMRRMPKGDRLRWVDSVPSDLDILMDADDAGECLGNLLDNARKWASGVVRVEATLREGRAVVSVLDDGPGFDTDAMPLLKVRGGQAFPGRDDGNGLGLAIVDDVLGAYDSLVEFEVPRQGGCRASFTVPARKAARNGPETG